MELIFEITNRSGRSLERYKLGGEIITIGRAYDNDLILSDETIDAHHAEIAKNEDGDIIISDLDSTNGIRNNKQEKLKGKIILVSGDVYLLGKTRIRIFTSDHPIAETISLSNIDSAISQISSNWMTLITFVILNVVVILETWLNLATDVKWESFFYPVFGVLAFSLAVALFWGLIGRIAKHELRLKVHFTLVSIYILSAVAAGHIYEVALFNSLNYILMISLYIVFSILSMTVLIWFNLNIATYQSNQQRWKLAGFLSVTLISALMFSEIVEQTNFSPNPHYIAEVKPPILNFSSAKRPGQFIKESTYIYDRNEDSEE